MVDENIAKNSIKENRRNHKIKENKAPTQIQRI